MVIQKELTIKELFDEMNHLRYKLIELSLKCNRTLTVTAVSWKDVIVKGGKKDDIMLKNEIKKEEAKNEYDIVLESYNDYKTQAIDKIKDMIATKPIEYCIVYFRDVLHWKWKDICKLFNYSLRQCHNLYNKGKEKS